MSQWRAILWLRARLLFRLGGASGRVAFVLAAALVTYFASWASRGLGLYFAHASPEESAAAIHLVLAALYALWITSPLLGYPFSEFHDVTRLLVYPVSHGRAFAASTVASLLSLSSVFLAGIAYALAVGPGGPPWAVAIRLALFLLLAFHSAALAHAIHLALLAILPARRLRDLAMLLAPLVSIGLYVAFRLAIGSPGAGKGLPALPRPGPWFLLVPTRWISGLLADPVSAPLWEWALGLGGFLAFTGVVVRAGAKLQERAFYGEILDRRPRVESHATTRRVSSRLAALLAPLLPGPVRAIAYKEWVVLRRDPALANFFLRQIAISLLPLFLLLLDGAQTQSESAGGILAFLVAFLLLSQSAVLSNVFGTDGASVVELLLRGQDRRHVFLGKNLCHVTLYLALDATVILAFGLAFDRMAFVGPLLFFAACSTFVLAGCGNVASVYLPHPLTRWGTRALEQQPERPEGCAAVLLRLATGALGMAATAPVAALTWLGFAHATGPVRAASLALAAAYALAGYLLSVFAAAACLRGREEELLRALA